MIDSQRLYRSGTSGQQGNMAYVPAATAAVCLLLCACASAQQMYTGNIAYDTPIVRRSDLAVPEPAVAQELGMKRRLLSSTSHWRSLLTNKWGKASDDEAKVFPQSVASGDPTDTGVILWTRVPSNEKAVEVEWAIASDKDMKKIVKSGSAVTSGDVAYSVKIDVDGLQAATWYYYQFRYGSTYSVVGHTRTLPKPGSKVDRASFAVGACSNYPVGYFNAYKTIAEFADAGKLDAFLHVGDYIYESGSKSALPAGEDDRSHKPAKEIVTLDDYRTRYNQYNGDVDLRRMRASLPMIAVWDDHEFANNAWHWGAQNHNNGDGEDPQLTWQERKTNAIRAYYEMQPIRQVDPDDIDRIYRNFVWGDLLNLMMLDTRYYGRDQEYHGPYNVTDLRYYNSSRSMLGSSQREWLQHQLLDTQKEGITWKVIGQQVVFNHRRQNDKGALNTDAWDGYWAERERIYDTVEQHGIDNLVVLAGDWHASFASDLAREGDKVWEAGTETGYNPATGQGSLGVEFVCNSITSNPFDDYGSILKQCDAVRYDNGFYRNNPNLKYVQSYHRGFLWLQLDHSQVAATWVDMSTIKSRDYAVSYSDTYISKSGHNYLEKHTEVYLPKTPLPQCEGSLP